MATIILYNKYILREIKMIPVVSDGKNLTYHADFHFSNINLSDSGIYKCEGFVDDDINSSFIIPSDVVEDYTTVNVKSECNYVHFDHLRFMTCTFFSLFQLL